MHETYPDGGAVGAPGADSGSEASAPSPNPTAPAGMAFSGLAVLTLLNLLNYIDRMILPAVLTHVQADLKIDDAQAGLLGTGFVIVLLAASPVFGVLGDALSRTRILAIGAGLWSLATAASGLARGFPHLLGARVAVGIGEAAYGTVAPSLLSDFYPPHVRGRIFAYFYAAIPVGSALGYVLGGVVAHHMDWRAAFFIAGLPGLLLALWALLLREPRRGRFDTPAEPTEDSAHGKISLRTYFELMRNPIYLWTVAGYSAATFAIGGLSFWMPKFLTTARGLGPEEAATVFGVVLAVAGFVGSLGGGWLADYGMKYTKNAYLWIPGLTTLLAVPVGIVALTSPVRSVFLPAIFVSGVLLFASTGPINAMLVNVVSPTMRASAIAAATVSIHLFGDAPSSWIIGLISDHSNLQTGVLIVPAFIALSGLIWAGTAWRLDRQGGPPLRSEAAGDLPDKGATP